MEWIEWVFSGVGVTAVTIIGGLLIKKKRNESQQSIQAGSHSNNIQGGRDVKVSIGEKKNVE
jgi:hypothetical protein